MVTSLAAFVNMNSSEHQDEFFGETGPTYKKVTTQQCYSYAPCDPRHVFALGSCIPAHKNNLNFYIRRRFVLQRISNRLLWEPGLHRSPNGLPSLLKPPYLDARDPDYFVTIRKKLRREIGKSGCIVNLCNDRIKVR
jgi:hypothetical protein